MQVADSSLAALELLNSLDSLVEPGNMVTRLRLDAAEFEPAAEPHPVQRGRPCKKGARITLVLLGLYSWVTVLAHHSQQHGWLPTHQAAWYANGWPTFSDDLAVVRNNIWDHRGF